MRVLVTGASGVFGREIVSRLAAQGHDVVATSRRRPVDLPPGATFVPADIRDVEALSAAVEGCDVVAHCAWAVGAIHDEYEERRINVGGTENVIRAMDRARARRLVFASSSTAYGPRPENRLVDEATELRPHPGHSYARHKAEVEQLIAGSDVEAVVIRTAVVLGRNIDNRIWSFMAAPLQVVVKGRPPAWQVVHADDVGRFFVQACEGGPSGAVNLAAPGSFTSEDLARVFGRRLLEVPEPVIRRGIQVLWDRRTLDVSPAELDFMMAMPVMVTDKLSEAWGFECAWSAEEALEDTRLAVNGVAVLGNHVVAFPWRLRFTSSIPTGHEAPSDGHDLVHAAPEGVRGEFDTPIDPRFPTYTMTNVGEALPGPATPLSLSVVARGLRAAGGTAAELLRFPGVLGAESYDRLQSIFGHRLFVNVSCAVAVGRTMPGWDEETLVDQYVGRYAGTIALEGAEPPPPPPSRSLGAKVRESVGLLVRGVGLAAGFSADVDDLVMEVGRLERLAASPESMTDGRLRDMTTLARDLVIHGWRVAGRGAIIAGAASTVAARLGADVTGEISSPASELPSGAALAGVRRLAAEARAEPEVAAVLARDGEGILEQITAISPPFAQEVADALDRFGHRGPAECELASRSMADNPDFLLHMVAKAMGAPVGRREGPGDPRPARPWAKAALRRASRYTSERERGRDRVVRAIWILRALARERGRRLVLAGLLEEVDDVFYLTFDELFACLPEGQALVRRRRTERQRLAAIRMPSVFSGTWRPEEVRGSLSSGERLAGVAASAGRAKGRVRIVTPETADNLEPGEILVAYVTDVGYTPLFAAAAAVVTDVGGVMSHAAVVARDFGIPAVVDTGVATLQLCDGMLVEVDGTEGSVTVLE